MVVPEQYNLACWEDLESVFSSHALARIIFTGIKTILLDIVCGFLDVY